MFWNVIFKSIGQSKIIKISFAKFQCILISRKAKKLFNYSVINACQGLRENDCIYRNQYINPSHRTPLHTSHHQGSVSRKARVMGFILDYKIYLHFHYYIIGTSFRNTLRKYKKIVLYLLLPPLNVSRKDIKFNIDSKFIHISSAHVISKQ